MDVPTHDSHGLRVYREILARDARSFGLWDSRYGPAALAAPRSECATPANPNECYEAGCTFRYTADYSISFRLRIQPRAGRRGGAGASLLDALRLQILMRFGSRRFGYFFRSDEYGFI